MMVIELSSINGMKRFSVSASRKSVLLGSIQYVGPRLDS